MVVHRAKKSGERADRVDMAQVRFTAADIRMMLGFVVVLSALNAWFVRSSCERVGDKLQIAMQTTYVTKEDFKSSAQVINQRLTEVHDDVSRLATEQQVKK